jgi:hypothetical protein
MEHSVFTEIHELAQQIYAKGHAVASKRHVESDTIIEIDEAFLEDARKQIQAWKEQYPQLDSLPHKKEATPLTDAYIALLYAPLPYSEVNFIYACLIDIYLGRENYHL